MKVIQLATLATVLVAPTALFAQMTIPDSTPLSEVVAKLYEEEIRTNIAIGADERTALSDYDEALILTGAISNQLSTFPIGSSAGGFTWSFNPEVGMFTRSAASYGPLFAERSLTVGRGKVNLGFNLQHTRHTSFEARDLKDREVVFFTPFPSGNIGEDALFLDASTTTFGIFGNYGITDQLDVGVALPIVSVKLDANIRFRFVNDDGTPAGNFEQIISGGGSAAGIGDILVRGKYRFVDMPGGGIAMGVDLRLPTGNEADLLGIPGSQTKVYGIFSTMANNFGPHVNFGYTFSNPNKAADDPFSVFLPPPDEFSYAVGVDVAVNPKLTVASDLVGRGLRDTPRLAFTDVGLGADLSEFAFQGTGTLNVALLSLGAKYNVGGNLLVSLNVLVPLTDGGLRPNTTPVVGLDYSF